ncbi:MAG: CheR family methyltransferase [Nannocystaceae bacterium]|nr:chemotaxis protein CheR [bacterium]
MGIPAAAASFEGKLAITDAEYERARTMLYGACGVALEGDRRPLVLGRLQGVIRSMKLVSFTDYLDRVEADGSGRLLSELVNHISTNYTYFGREWEHFEHYRSRGIPEAKRRNRSTRSLRVWCAATSTGEEPYTLAALLPDIIGPEYRNWDGGVLGTDINTDVLETAAEGYYDAEDIERLDPDMRKRWFMQEGSRVRVADRIRRDVLFRRFNLTNPMFPWRRPFDVIFCRNVMIYFDQTTKKSLGERLANALCKGGYLYIGIAESLQFNRKLLRPVQAGIFERI